MVHPRAQITWNFGKFVQEKLGHICACKTFLSVAKNRILLKVHCSVSLFFCQNIRAAADGRGSLFFAAFTLFAGSLTDLLLLTRLFFLSFRVQVNWLQAQMMAIRIFETE